MIKLARLRGKISRSLVAAIFGGLLAAGIVGDRYPEFLQNLVDR